MRDDDLIASHLTAKQAVFFETEGQHHPLVQTTPHVRAEGVRKLGGNELLVGDRLERRVARLRFFNGRVNLIREVVRQVRDLDSFSS